MKKQMNAVKDFHDTFGLSYNDSPTVALEKKIIELRYNLMKEENEEYIEAARKNDIIEVADALGGYALYFVWNDN